MLLRATIMDVRYVEARDGHTWENWRDRLREGLSAKGIPNRVDSRGPEWDHEWPTWWWMLPQYLDELV